MEILDQSGDLNGQITYNIYKRFTPPAFVKSASSEDLYGGSMMMPPASYADPGRSRFPVHTPAATWLSTAFFLKNQDKLNSKLASWIGETLDKMASYHNIKNEVETLKLAWSKDATDGLELSDDDFALMINYADGKVERKYPLRNSKEVRAAAEYLSNHQDDIPFEDRMMMSRKILEKAARFGADLKNYDDFLEKQAGYGGCSHEDAINLIWTRVKVLNDSPKPSELQIELAKMAKICYEKPDQVRSQEMLTKLACIIDTVDRSNNVKYSEILRRPEDVLFRYTRKQASQFMTEHCKTLSGTVYKLADFNKIKLQDVRDMFGNEFAEAVTSDGIKVAPEKMAEVAPTLPRPDAELLDRLLEDVGILPYSKEASANNKLSKEELRFVAQLRTLTS